MTTYTDDEIKSGLAKLEPDIPWTHYFDFRNGIETITQDNEVFYKKSIGLRKLGKLASELVLSHTKKGALNGMRILDVASAEGGHSIAMAQKGANVVGIEGRELYVKRAQFVAQTLGCENASFVRGDVREIEMDKIGTFDLVLCFGILHHLDIKSFKKFLESMYQLTDDTLIIYTHISTPDSIKQFNLKGPMKSEDLYEGYLFREHSAFASKKKKEASVRASLDNTKSFWATRESLNKCLGDVGFTYIYEVIKPHIFTNMLNASFRPIIIARK